MPACARPPRPGRRGPGRPVAQGAVAAEPDHGQGDRRARGEAARGDQGRDQRHQLAVGQVPVAGVGGRQQVRQQVVTRRGPTPNDQVRDEGRQVAPHAGRRLGRLGVPAERVGREGGVGEDAEADLITGCDPDHLADDGDGERCGQDRDQVGTRTGGGQPIDVLLRQRGDPGPEPLDPRGRRRPGTRGGEGGRAPPRRGTARRARRPGSRAGRCSAAGAARAAAARSWPVTIQPGRPAPSEVRTRGERRRGGRRAAGRTGSGRGSGSGAGSRPWGSLRCRCNATMHVPRSRCRVQRERMGRCRRRSTTTRGGTLLADALMRVAANRGLERRRACGTSPPRRV